MDYNQFKDFESAWGLIMGHLSSEQVDLPALHHTLTHELESSISSVSLAQGVVLGYNMQYNVEYGVAYLLFTVRFFEDQETTVLVYPAQDISLMTYTNAMVGSILTSVSFDYAGSRQVIHVGPAQEGV